MTPEEFAAAIKVRAFDSATSSVMTQLRHGAPGRGPHPRADALSDWFNSLPESDQGMVAEIVRDASHAAIFGMLCMLDGVSVIDDPPHGTLTLVATEADGTTTTLASTHSAIELHDEFNALVHPPSESWPGIA